MGFTMNDCNVTLRTSANLDNPGVLKCIKSTVAHPHHVKLVSLHVVQIDRNRCVRTRGNGAAWGSYCNLARSYSIKEATVLIESQCCRLFELNKVQLV